MKADAMIHLTTRRVRKAVNVSHPRNSLVWVILPKLVSTETDRLVSVPLAEVPQHNRAVE
jgi:hypothetical protein